MSTQLGPDATAFRGDIQGVRAFAVLAVLAAHAGVPFLPGGFVGVDVFFVVSGFLITRLILKGIGSEGGFSPMRFYARRARRILPAASFVLALTMVASLVYLTFLDALRVAEDVAWAAVFAANLRFLDQNVDYYAQDQAPSPVQHFWSLAVEEQFYLVWPALVLVVVLVARPRRRYLGEVPVAGIGILVALLGTVSFVYSLQLTASEPQASYFSSPARAWELAVGCVLACVLSGGWAAWRRIPPGLLAFGGAAAIGFALVGFDETVAFPGVAALAPVLGTAALIVAGADPDHLPVVSRVLGIRPLQIIGDWSYSIYLWHWPLIVIPATRLDRPLTATEMFVSVALTFQLSWLTYRFVEKPFRTGEGWQLRPARGLVLYPASIVLVLGVAAGGHGMASYLGSERGDNPPIRTADVGIDGNTITDQVRASVVAAREGLPIPSDLTPDLIDLNEEIADVGACDYNDVAEEDWDLCPRGDPDGEKTLVVTGDSHARAWIPAFEQIARAAGYRAYYFVKGRCTAAYVLPGLPGTGDPNPECVGFHEWVAEQVEELRPDLMVVTTAPPFNGVYVGDEHITAPDDVAEISSDGFDDAFSTYRPLTERLVLLVDVPQLSIDPGPCLSERSAKLRDCTIPPAEGSALMRNVSIESAERFDVETVDPGGWLCADGLCPTVIGSTITYRDPGHITTTRAEELWLALGLALGVLEVSPADDPD